MANRGITRPFVAPLTRPLVGTRRRGGVSYDADAQALFARYSSDPGSEIKGYQNDLIVGLKDDGIYSEIDAFFMLAAHDTQAELLDWRRSSVSAVAVNSPAFEAFRGATGNGSSSRIRTNYTPSTDAVNFAQDNASLWVWCRTAVQANAADAGSITAPRTFIISNGSGANATACVNSGTNNAVDGVGTSVGFTGVQRTTSTHARGFKDGVQAGTDIAAASTGLPAQEQWICGANVTHFSERQIACAMWASSLTGKEAALYNHVHTYMQAIGAA